MKRKLIYTSAIVVLVAFMAAGVIAVSKTNQDKTSADAVVSCAGKTGQSHQVMIMDDKATPTNTTGKLCDTLTITNHDDITRLVAFGPHEDHIPYDGVADKILLQGQSFTVTLNATGNYRFH